MSSDATSSTLPNAAAVPPAAAREVHAAARPVAHAPVTVPALKSSFVPVFIVMLALTGWFAANVYELYKQRGLLQAAFASQQQTVDNAAKLRASLDALAADTQRLANGGNTNAGLLVDELRKRGVTINVPAPGAAAPASAPR